MMGIKSKELRAMITLAGKIDPSLQMAMLKASKESAKASGQIGRQWGSLGNKIKGGAKGLFKGLAAGIAATAVAASVAFGAMGAAGLNYASDLQEVENVVSKTFGEQSAVIDAFASRSLETYGLTALEAKNYSSTLGSMLKSMGMTSQQTLTMSQNMTALAGDMASFKNLSAEEAFQKIQSGISGEMEPLKELGIVMSVANLEAYAMSQGITTAFSKMSQQEQTLLRYNYLMEQTADMQGDFADTSDGFANQQRLLKANLQQTSGEIMSNMIPALAAGMQEANRFITSMDTAAVGRFAGELATMAMGFMPLVMDLMPAFGNLLMMLMPPLIEVGQMLIPVVVDVVRALVDAITPLMPIFLNLVQIILPPMKALIQAIAPLVSTLASIFSVVLAPALSLVSGILTPLCEMIAKFAGPVAELAGKIASLWSGGVVEGTAQAIENDKEQLGLYAKGGFSSKPAIFGEAGLEAAIPIKPGNPRSIGLLHKTAQLLGIGNQFNHDGDDQRKFSFTYAPVIHAEGSTGNQIDGMLRRGYAEMRRMIEEIFDDRRRLAWE